MPVCLDGMGWRRWRDWNGLAWVAEVTRLAGDWNGIWMLAGLEWVGGGGGSDGRMGDGDWNDVSHAPASGTRRIYIYIYIYIHTSKCSGVNVGLLLQMCQTKHRCVRCLFS